MDTSRGLVPSWRGAAAVAAGAVLLQPASLLCRDETLWEERQPLAEGPGNPQAITEISLPT
jgi:hypothetical protein